MVLICFLAVDDNCAARLGALDSPSFFLRLLLAVLNSAYVFTLELLHYAFTTFDTVDLFQTPLEVFLVLDAVRVVLKFK